MRCIAIIQARLSSQRLPNKVLLQIPPNSGVSMLELVVRKAMLATKVDEVCVVTPDLFILNLCDRWNVMAYMPNWTGRDVLREYYEVAKSYNLNYEVQPAIVRLTADCPLVRPEIIDHCVGKFLESEVDLVYNTDCVNGNMINDGYDVECFSYEALKQSHKKAKENEREHTTQWMRKNLRILKFNHINYEGCSVNTLQEYIRVCQIIAKQQNGARHVT